jgi:predicted RecB family nuclease
LSQNDLDPRRPFAESLIRTLATPGPIVVYSSFEKSCLNALAIQFPDLAELLHKIIKRFVDLYNLIRNHAYHPQFGGSFSIKAVLPALVPHLSYQGLAIADGVTAANSFAKTLRTQTSAPERATIYADLHRYCLQDTLAMVEIYRTLLAIK